MPGTTDSQDTTGPARAVILLSGGMDSATLLKFAAGRLQIPEIHALSFHYGQRHIREIESARWQARETRVHTHREIDMGFFGDMTAAGSVLTNPETDIPGIQHLSATERNQPPTYVPNRNMVLLSVAAAYAETNGITDVYYGAQAQDQYGYWDCVVDFVAEMNHVLALNRGAAVTVHAPFIEMRKAEVLRIGRDLGVDYSHTWTCYRGEDVPCGHCPSCSERALAFREIGETDELHGNCDEREGLNAGTTA